MQSLITPIWDMRSSETTPIGHTPECVHPGVPVEAFGQIRSGRTCGHPCRRNRLLTPPRTAYWAEHPEQAECRRT